MAVISLSTCITNTVRYIRHVSQAIAIRHSCSIHYTKRLLNLFQADLTWIAQDAFQNISEVCPEPECAPRKNFGCWCFANFGASSPSPFERNRHPCHKYTSSFDLDHSHCKNHDANNICYRTSSDLSSFDLNHSHKNHGFIHSSLTGTMMATVL